MRITVGQGVRGVAVLLGVAALASTASQASADPALQAPTEPEQAGSSCVTVSSGLVGGCPADMSCTLDVACPAGKAVFDGSCRGGTGDRLYDAYRLNPDVYRCRWFTESNVSHETKAICCDWS